MWGEVRVRVQVSRREFHTHIYLDYVTVEFLSYIKKKIIKDLWAFMDQPHVVKVILFYLIDTKKILLYFHKK